MIALPAQFKSRRETGSGTVELKGPGCVRHIWFLKGNGTRLDINVDGAGVSQVDVPLEPFFGIMHGLDPYPVDCAAYTVLPNPVAGKAGVPGYNLWLPIPFSKTCRMTLPPQIDYMIDWQQYDEQTTLTPYRLHADYRSYKPSPPRGGFVELANIEGEGFIAGLVIGYIQRNKINMVFHTGGMTFLLDGESDPYAMRGNNVEDDFGFSWGFNDRQSRWIGCPWHKNRGQFDQDGVFYRFFGPDPISFQSSVLFRTGCRGDDMESVVYSYRIPGTLAPKIQAPSKWQVTGLFMPGSWEEFAKSQFTPPNAPVEQWPDKPDLNYPTKETFKIFAAELPSDRGWIDLQNVFFERNHEYTPLTVLDRCAYARTILASDADEQAVLRLALDDWAIVWLNGEKVATLRHDDGLRIARIPVKLRKGNNDLLIKTNNSNAPTNNRLWVMHAVLEKGKLSNPKLHE